jgi:hypothetical protein
MPEIDGATGVLYLDGGGRIHRRLAWAEFRGGQPVPLPPPEGTGSSLRTIGEDGAAKPEDSDNGETWYEETREL